MSQWGQPGFQYPMQTGFPGVQQQQQSFQPSQHLNQNAQFQQSPVGFGGQPGAVPPMGAGFGGLTSQPTGFPGPRPPPFLQHQQTGFPGTPGGHGGLLQSQPTGFPGAQMGFGQRPPPPPVPPIPSQFQQNVPMPPPPPPPAPLQQQSGFLNPSQNRFGGPGLGPQPTGLVPQPTGFAGRSPAPLVPQMTGFMDPRLQMMSSSFMPANLSAPYATGGAPQLQPNPQQQFGGMSLQQSFQQHNQQLGRGATPKIPWALSKAEKKNYDQIFRAWDVQGTGFISGQTALEVFGQSGIDRNELAKIWSLADGDNRGKLNLAEFHVAMGLIYRRLNGSEVPDELPPELVPPSSRDLDTSVNFLKDILKNDTRARSPSALDTPVSRLKERSFTSPSTTLTQQGGRQDATVYRHEDVPPPGGFYQSSVRHIDRNAVRSQSDEANPAASDIASLKRQLLSTQQMLDDKLSSEHESDQLDRDLEDLRYRIKRLQEDLEYVSRGPRTTTKDEERRRLERELVRLMHEEVPELERKVEEREARKEREKRKWTNERDKRNERFGRFAGEEGGRYSPALESKYGSEDDRPYSRSGSKYERDERDYYDRDERKPYRSDESDRRQDREKVADVRSATRSPPAAAPVVRSATRVNSPPTAPPATSRSPAPQLKNMTPEQRRAFIQAEAKRRLEDRMQALGYSTPAPTSAVSPTLDTSVEDRLEREKREAEEKAREAERQAEEREQLRKQKLEAERAIKAGKSPTPTPTPTSTAPAPSPAPAPTPTAPVSRPAPTPTTPAAKAALPAPKSRAPAPPPRRKGFAPRTPATVAAPAPAPAPPVQAFAPAPAPAPPAPTEPEEDPEDVALRAREAALRKKREEREALLRRLEEEERMNEEAYQQRRTQFLAAKAAASPAVSPASTTQNSPVPPAPPAPPAPAAQPVYTPPAVAPAPLTPEVEAEEAVPPPPPPPPPAPPASAAADKPSNNPFNRLKKDGNAPALETTSSPANVSNSNPFFRSQTAPPPTAPTPPRSPGVPPPVKTTYHTVPSGSDDDWDDVVEKEEDNSSDEELATRDTRVGLAQQLFGSLLPARPQSAGPAPQSTGNAVSPTPPPPTAPPAPAAPAPPPAPVAPAPPRSPAPVTPSAAPGDRGALLSAIQGGAALRKTVTNDRSAAATAGKVVGDNIVPAHINATPRPPSPLSPPAPAARALSANEVSEPLPVESTLTSKHRPAESVDWYNELAADHAGQVTLDHLPETVEEEEEYAEDVPAITVSEHVPGEVSDPMADVDKSTELRVRSLYLYEAQRTEDLHFGENVIIEAHPSKSGSDWWYGTTVNDGRSGFFPQTYVQVVEPVQATALYSYEGSTPDELSFTEGDVLTIVDRMESDWWKAERDGLVYLVPAAYVEVAEVQLSSIFGSERRDLQSAGGERLDSVPDRETMSNDSYGTPYSSPAKTRKLDRMPEITGTDNDEDDDDDDYYSLDDDGASDVSEASDVDATETLADQERQEMERRRVLEAAGVIVSDLKDHNRSVSLPQHTNGHRGDAAGLGGPAGKRGSSIGAALPRRRVSEALPPTHEPLSCARHKQLPPVPMMDISEDSEAAGHTGTNARLSPISEMLSTSVQPTHLKTTSESSSTSRVDDAFERYETYKKLHGGQSLAANRMSASSFDTSSSLTFSSPPRSPAVSLSPSLRDKEQERGGESRTSHFLSFLGRHTRSTTPDIDRERKIPIISGPIRVSASNTAILPGELPSSTTRENSPGFGTSWASLVDKTALEGIPAVERKRQEAIFELISTEADYVRDLQLIVELFYSRLMAMLGEDSTSVIFSNIEDILLTNTAFLSTLEERQRECRLYVDHVGDLLETHMPHMRVYLAYCVNQANGGKVLQSLRHTNPELSTQLQCLREDPSARNLDLASYLLVPMQRLTRYPLLIRQILQYTDPPASTLDLSSAPRLTLSLPTEHAERESIANALACAEKILGEVNETIRGRESWARLGQVSRELRIGKDRLDLTLPTHHLGPRMLLKEGVLTKAKSGRRLRALLCSDLLLLINESGGGGIYRVPLPVHELDIRTSRNHFRFDDAYIRIHRAYPRGGDTLVLRAPSVREARAWTEAIVQAAARAKEGIRAAVGNSRGTEVGFGPAIIGVGMGHVAGAGTPRPSGDVGNKGVGVTTGS